MLPSLDRKDGVEARETPLRRSATTPGISRGSRAMLTRDSCISLMLSRNRRTLFKSIDSKQIHAGADVGGEMNEGCGSGCGS